jgi:hypothetical protein
MISRPALRKMNLMSQEPHNPDQPLVYEVRLKGHLDDDWKDWFGGVTVTPQADGTTLLFCHVVDQAALHGLLRQIRDLGLPLISVNRIEA